MTGGGGGNGGGGGAAAQAAKYPYQRGSILRIRMHNFLTYEDAEVTPGPRLNMVVGPNGSGKSTILCAVSLGLGAGKKNLERAGSLGDFVMRDKDKGWVEITLKSARGGGNVKIRRDLERGNDKSKWRLDDQPTTQTQVHEVVKKLGIDTENLCTFLPQEKVGKFTEMNAQELLVETERSLTDMDLHQTHLDLIEKQNSMQSADKDRDTLEKQLEKKEAELAGLTRSKEQLENRQRLLDKAAVYEKVVKSLKFGKIQRAAARVKAEKEELDRQLKEVQKAQEPFQRRVQTCKQGATAAGKAVASSQAAFAGAKEAVAAASQEVEGERHDDLQSAKNELSSVARERERLEQKREQTQRQLETAIRVRDGVNVEELKERSAATQDRLRRAKAEHDAQREALAEARQAQQDAKAEADEAEAKLRHLLDSKNQRLRNLASNRSNKFSQAPDAVKTHMWIQQNRAQFRGRVFGPVALEVSVESQEHAAMVEHHFAAHLLLGFVVENAADKELILEECTTKQKLKISVLELPNRWEQEVNKEYYTAGDLQELRKHGISGVMEQFIQAPDQVKAAMRSVGNMHRVLVGDAKTEKEVGQGLMEQLCKFSASGPLARGGGGGGEDDGERNGSAVVFTRRPGAQGGIVQHRATTSRYTGQVSTMSRMVPLNPTIMGRGAAADAEYDQQVAAAKAQRDEQQKRHKELGHAIADQLEKEEAAGTQKVKFEKEAQALKKRIQEAKGAKEQVGRLQQKLREIEAELEQDVGAQREELQRAVQAAAGALVDGVVALGASVEALVGVWAGRVAPKLAHSAALKLQQAAEREQRAAAERHSGLAADFERKNSEFRRMMETLKREKKEISESVARSNDAVRVQQLMQSDYSVELQAQDGETPEQTADRLVVECEAERDGAEEEAGRIADNPEALAQYERVSREVAALKKRHAELQRNCESGQSDLERLAAPWAEKLRQLVCKLTVRFQEYMAQMGCEGEVRLAEEPADYGKWQLQIWVKFRREAKLQALSAKVHSGGERSVSTILFLMGLQDVIGASPFRAVDEINQGMDERNERLVFSRIVANSTKNQYFLVTPKLLPGLTAMEADHVTVLFVFNAPELLPFDRWDVRAFLQAVAARKAQGANGGGGGGGGGASGAGAGSKGKRSRGLEAEMEEEEDKSDDYEEPKGGKKKRRSEGEGAQA